MLFNLDYIGMPSLLAGLATIGVIILLGRTKLRNYALVIALLLASVALLVLGLDSFGLV